MNIEKLVQDADPAANFPIPAHDSPLARRSFERMLASPPSRLAEATDAAASAPSHWGRPGHRIRNLAIAGTLAVVLAAVAAVTLPHAGQTGTARTTASRPTPAPPGAWWTYKIPSLGVAASAAQLVAYATEAAARAPLFPVPKPTEWYYTETLVMPNPGFKPGIEQYWQQIGSHRAAFAAGDGKLSYRFDGGPGSSLMGWPGNWTTMYRYLAGLPASVSALRAVILANVEKQGLASLGPTEGAFTAIGWLLDDFAVPPRLQAELYGVLLSLPGVRFAASVTDGAGRAGAGIYVIEGGRWLEHEIIVDPRTYAYMGAMEVAVKAHTVHCIGRCWPKVTHYRKGQALGWSAQLAAGVVQQAGQIPGR